MKLSFYIIFLMNFGIPKHRSKNVVFSRFGNWEITLVSVKQSINWYAENYTKILTAFQVYFRGENYLLIFSSCLHQLQLLNNGSTMTVTGWMLAVKFVCHRNR